VDLPWISASLFFSVGTLLVVIIEVFFSDWIDTWLLIHAIRFLWRRMKNPRDDKALEITCVFTQGIKPN